MNNFKGLLHVLQVTILVCTTTFIFSQDIDACDVNLIEVAIVDVTGLNGQPDFNDANICSQSDTIRIEMGTPGIQCNPTATITLNEFRAFLPDGFLIEDIILSGGIGSPWIAGTDYIYNEALGTISIDFNPGDNVAIDQNNPFIIDIVLEPGCEIMDLTFVFPTFELDYSLPGNIAAQSSGIGVIDLKTGISEPFLNILNTSTTPAAELPGEIVCRTATIVNNGLNSLLDTLTFCDIPQFPFASITSFEITPIENSTIGTPIDALADLPTTTDLDSIEFTVDGTTYGGPNSMFEVNGGIIVDYCFETSCPPGVNNSSLRAKWGCSGLVCQEATGLESIVVNFSGIPDLLIDRTPLLGDDACNDPMMWEFRIVNDENAGGAFETTDGEADAQNLKLTLQKNMCESFEYVDYKVNYGIEGGANTDETATVTITDMGDSLSITGLPDISVGDTLIFKFNLMPPADDGSPLECEEIYNAAEPNCLDPYIKVNYTDRCDKEFINEQSQPASASLPPTDGNPVVSFVEADYVEPSYCSPGKLTFEMSNVSGLGGPTTEAQDIQFYVRKEFCDLYDIINYEYGADASTGNSTGIAIDDTSLDSFYVVSIPASENIAQGESIFFSFEIELGCRNSEACVFDGYDCIMPDVKAVWKSCFGFSWLQPYEFPYKLIDHKPDPKNSLESFGGGSGPNSLRGSGCGFRNYYYRYQFGGIDHTDCRVFLRYKVAQINADGTAGTVQTVAEMAAGVGSATGATSFSTISGVGGAPDTLVIEVESDLLESCIEEEELLINVQFATKCTLQTEPVKYYESYEVIFECNNGSECCSFKRSCYENVIDCYCGTPGTVASCYLFCVETTEADLCRLTEGCTPAPEGFATTPDPKNIGLACDVFNLTAKAEFSRTGAGPTEPRCDTIDMMTVTVDPGPYMSYVPGTADFTVYEDGVATASTCGAAIPYDAINDEFDLSACVDWEGVMDGDSIVFTADWIVDDEVPECADGFMQEDMAVRFKGKFVDGGNITDCGGVKKAEYLVGDPFKAKMLASLEFANNCELKGQVLMFDDCGSGNLFNDYRPGYILDSIVYNVTGIDITYVSGSAVLSRKGLNGPETISIPDAQIISDNSNGLKLVFENDGTWPEELTRDNANDSLFCLLFDLEFEECYDYMTNVQANSEIYYHSCGGCGQKMTVSPGGIELNNPPQAILNCLGAPIVQVPNDSVTWSIQVGHTPSASLHWVALDLPEDISVWKVFNETTGTDILADAQTGADGVIFWELGDESIDDLTICALYTGCDTTYVPVYAGWACNGYPTDPATGEFIPGEFCDLLQKELAVVRAGTGLQAAYTTMPTGAVPLCSEEEYEIQIKNVGTSSNFLQEVCFFLPKDGIELIPGSVCIAHPDTIATLDNQGAYFNIPDAQVILSNPDTLVNGQRSIKYSVDLLSLPLAWGAMAELPGAKFPEDNTNKYRIKWKVSTNCDYVSGGRVFLEAQAQDRCGVTITTKAESSDLLAIENLDPRDLNRNQVVILDSMLRACVGPQAFTVNVVSFPSVIGDNEYVCIVFPPDATYLGASGFNPVSWDFSAANTVETTLSDGSVERCWKIPAGTPPGVLVFNVDLEIDNTTECGTMDFTSYSKAQDDAFCVLDGSTCPMEVITSDLSASRIELIPALSFVSERFEVEASCSAAGDLSIDTQIAIQNNGDEIPAGVPTEITVFADLNNNSTLDAGEELTTGFYDGGFFPSQIVFIDVVADVTFEEICNLMVVPTTEGCACAADASEIPVDLVDLNICNPTPLVCEGGQSSLFCMELPDVGYTLDWSSPNDPELIYIDQATGTFGPAPVGVYTYEIEMDLGGGCELSGRCSMQVIGDLGEFTMSGSPTCVDEIGKCTIELEPICTKGPFESTGLNSISCTNFNSSTGNEGTYTINVVNGSNNLEMVAPVDPDTTDLWIDNFNNDLLDMMEDIGEEVCYINEFGLSQSGFIVPQWKNNGLSAEIDYCQYQVCALLATRGFPTSGSIDVSFTGDCGMIMETFNYTSYSDLAELMTSWLNINGTLFGTGWGVDVGASGPILIDLGDVEANPECISGFTYLWTAGTSTRSTIVKGNCYKICNGGTLDLELLVFDINGNLIPEQPTQFCCGQLNKTFTVRTTRINRPCRGSATIQSAILNVTANFGEETLTENPLNSLLLYDWEVMDGDLISQEGNCANVRYGDVGTYTICATPLLSPESGLDCDFPQVCKEIEIYEDDVRATVAVEVPTTCSQQAILNVTFDSPDDIGEVTICGSDGNIVLTEMAPPACEIVIDFPLEDGTPDLTEIGAISINDEATYCYITGGASSAQDIVDCINSELCSGMAILVSESASQIVISMSGDATTCIEELSGSLYMGAYGDAYVYYEGCDEGSPFIDGVTAVLPSGDYTVKVTGLNCSTEAIYPINLPEPPSDELLAIIDSEMPSDCATADGSIAVDFQTNGQIDSLVLCDADGSVSTIDHSAASPPLQMVSESFTNLGVGTYEVKVFTECGDSTLTITLNSAADFINVVDPLVMQYTDCASADAEISFTAESNNPIDSIIWCGPEGIVVKEIGPLTSPHSASSGAGILYGIWTAKIYTACTYEEEVFNINAPPPGAAVEVSCVSNPPADCSEQFGSIDISVDYAPTGFVPDSIVLDAPGVHYVDDSGSTSVNFAPLVPGTYTITVYSWTACNNKEIECVILPPMDEASITDIDIPTLPCAKLDPEFEGNVVINYTTDPAQDIVRVDWYKGTDIASGVLVESHASPDNATDMLTLGAGDEGDYCVVVIAGDAGLFSTCPRDTLCFTVLAEECPPECALTLEQVTIMEHVDCGEGSVFDIEVNYTGLGCSITDAIDDGSGRFELKLRDASGLVVKSLTSTGLTSEITCFGVSPGTYTATVQFIDAEGIVCEESIEYTLTGANMIEYIIEVDITPTPCSEEVGKVVVTSVTDSDGNVYDITDFDYVLYDGFTPIAMTVSPDEPAFCDLKTDLYTVGLIDPNGCEVGSAGAIVPNNGEGEKISPLSILSGNNCGPCNGQIIMPDIPGIIYRLQDPAGNILFPEDPPQANIFKELCPGDYTIVAFDLSMDPPDACPSICDTIVPISEDGFFVKLDTLTASPCEIGDGRIMVMAQGGNCGYNYELYAADGTLVSDTPTPDPSASLCGDLSDMMMFTGLEPGTYKVVAFAADSEGNPMACMHMDSIVLRDNDIRISAADIVVVDPLCFEGTDGTITINGELGEGETMEVWDEADAVLGSFVSTDVTPYEITGVREGAYEVRITAGEGIFECTEIIDIEVNEPDSLELEITPADPSDCVEEDGSIDIVVSGGTAEYTIAWDDGSLSGFNVTGLGAGVYPFEVTDANGCTANGEAEIELPFCNEPCPDILPEFAVVDAECGESNGNIFVTVLDNPEDFTYLWDDSSTAQEREDLPSGIYCVTITSVDNSECSVEVCQEIDEIGGPIVSIEVEGATCTEDGKLTLNISEGTAPYTMTWDGPEDNDGGPIAAFDGDCIFGPAGDYNIAITDAEGCTNNVFATIEYAMGLQVLSTVSSFPSCDESDGAVSISVLGGVFPYEYYLNGLLHTTQNGTSLSFDNLTAGQYTFTVIDGNGCPGEVSVTLSSGGGPAIDPDDFIATPAICAGDDGSLSYAGGGDVTIEYKLYAENSTIPFATFTADQVVEFEAEVGAYFVVCEDTNTGCTDVLSSIEVTGPPQLDFVVQYLQPVDCENLGVINIVEITGGYATDDLDISITDSSGESVADALTTGNTLEADTYTITICYDGSDGTTACCKSREVIIVQDFSCCEELGGEVFYDNNNNGCQEDGEEAVTEEVGVNLYVCDVDGNPVGDPVASTNTGDDGQYQFGPDEEGEANICLDADLTYIVEFVLPNAEDDPLENYNFSTNDTEECDATSDSDDVDPEDGQSSCYDPSEDDDDEDIDAGIYPCEELGGEVFYDDNYNGCQDDGEEIVTADVEVNLYACDEEGNPDGDPVASTSTGEDGQYHFGPDEEGEAQICLDPAVTYLVEFVLPNAAEETLDGYDFTEGSGEDCEDTDTADNTDPDTGLTDCYDPFEDDDDEDIDAGIVRCEEIAGTVFFDWNEDGCQDAIDDGGVEGAIAYVYTCGEQNPTPENALASDTTDVNGDYSFGSMEEGDADICLHPDSSYYVVFEIANGGGEALEDFSFTEGDGATCDGEDNADDVDPITGQSDCYDPEDDDEIDSDDDQDIDAGITPPCEKIAGVVFVDINNNGCQEDTETDMVEGAVATLYECDDEGNLSGDPVSMDTTREDGSYYFAGLDPETGECLLDEDKTYTVVISVPNSPGEDYEGYDFSTGEGDEECAAAGMSDDVDPGTGQSECYDPNDDDEDDDDDDEHIDAGITPMCESIAGEVFIDLNNNGCQEDTEMDMVEGAIAMLMECDADGNPTGGLIASDTTGADGAWVFGGIDPETGECVLDEDKTYTVTISVPNAPGEAYEGYDFSTGVADEACEVAGMSDDIDPGTGQSDCYDPNNDDEDDDDDDEHIDAGITPMCESIAGVVFVDINNNGCQEDTETTMVAGAIAMLMECDESGDPTGGPIASDTTGADGAWVFGGVDPETGECVLDADKTYTVTISVPNAPGEVYAGYDFSTGEGDKDCVAAGMSDDVDPGTGQSACYDPNDDDEEDGEEDEHIDAGITPMCESLSGEVFVDLNNNGCQEDTEGEMVEGAIATLYECDESENPLETPIASDTTGADGAWTLGGIDPETGECLLDEDKTYTVVISVPNASGEDYEGYDFSTGVADEGCEVAGMSDDVDPGTGQSECYDPNDDDEDDDDDDEHIDAGITPMCESIAGEVFIDLNNNGCQEDTEMDMVEGAIAMLMECDENGNPTGGPIASDTTGADGAWVFGGIDPETGVCVLDEDKTYTVTISVPNAPGEAYEGYDFSTGVADSECEVAGMSDDIDPSTGQSECYDPNDDDENDDDDDEHIDAGITPMCESIGGEVFVDTNNSGCQEDTESTMVEGAVATLMECDASGNPTGTPIASDITGADGQFLFGGFDPETGECLLDPDKTYTVQISIPNGPGEAYEGYSLSTGNADSGCELAGMSDDVDSTTGQSECYDPKGDDDDEDIDAGITPDCESMGGEVFVDENGNGCQDDGEDQMVEGAIAILMECDPAGNPIGDPVAQDTSGADGEYVFGGFDPETGECLLDSDKTYTVQITYPNGPGEPFEGYVFTNGDGSSCEDSDTSDDVDPADGTSSCYDPTDNDGDDDDHIDGGIGVFDLALIKVIATPGPYQTGDLIEFVISVVNQGNVTAANVQIADHVPTGFSYEAVNNPAWDDAAAPLYHYDIPGVLVPSDTAFVSIFLTIEYVDQDDINYTNFAEISNTTNENGNPVTDIDSQPDNDKDNDGDYVDNTYDDKDDEDDHDPAVLPLTGLLPPCVPSCEAACIGQLNLSLGEACEATVSPSMLLANVETLCDDPANDGFFNISLTDQYGDPIANNLITADYLDQTITYSIEVLNGAMDCENSCWGNILVESKFAPVLECDESVQTISCIELAVFDGPPLSGSGTSGCFGAEVTIEILNEQVIDVDPCEGDLVKQVIRQYQAVDVSGGRSNICIQELHITKLDPSLIKIPVSTTVNLSCTAEIGTIGEEDIELGVVPFYCPATGSGTAPIPLYPANDNFCNIFIDYTDEVIIDQPCKKQVLRTWEIRQWHCNDEDVINVPPQLLTLIDEKPPELSCPTDTIEVSTSGSECTATLILPEIGAVDSCNAVSQIDMSYPGGFIENQNGGEINGVPVGLNAVTYLAYDACGNSSSCQVHINVVDDSAPVIICEGHVQVSLTNSGAAHVPATVFDDGSYDACGQLKIEARRMDLSCQKNEQDSTSIAFGDHVAFCCADVGTPQTVIMRVVSHSGAANRCMIQVTVVDKNPPSLVAPPDITVSCEFVFDENDLSIFGSVATSQITREEIVIDADSVNIDGVAVDGLVIGACGVEVNDNVDMGGVSSCGTGLITRVFSVTSNGITVSDDQTIKVVSPVDFDPDKIDWPRDTVLYDACLLSDLHPDDLPDGYDRPLIGEGVCELIGVSITNEQVLSADGTGFGCVKLFRTWSVIDWCNTGLDGLPARWDSIQLIGVENKTAPDIICADTVAVVNSFNANCAPVSVVLSAEAVDDCTNTSDLSWTWIIDLYSDGTVDTTGVGNEVNASYVPGVHQITWYVEDLCGNISVPCTQNFEVTNEKSAPAICLDHIITDLILMDTDSDGIVDLEMVEVWASDVIVESLSCGNPLSYSFDSAGLQDSIIYGCSEVGFNSVMIYATDPVSGAQSTCWTEIEVQDNNEEDICGTPLVGEGEGDNEADVSGIVLTESGAQISDTEVRLIGSELPNTTTDVNGQYAFNNMPMGGDYTVIPTKDINYMNGVSTLDLVLIQKHILGLELLDSPYKMIAADVNKSNSISAADIVQLRKLILGETDVFDNNDSWRFIDELHAFESVSNPWISLIPEYYDIYDLSTDMIADFVGVKVGDVTSNAKGDELVRAELRTSSDPLHLIGKVKNEGHFKVVNISSADFVQVNGFQTTIGFDADQYDFVKLDNETLDMSTENIGTRYASRGILTLSWHSEIAIDAALEDVLFRLYFRAKTGQATSIGLATNSSITVEEAYFNGEVTDKVDIEVIEESNSAKMVLDQNEPNPWRESTLIGFRIPDGGDVQLRLFDNTGKLIHKITNSFGIGYNEITIGRDIITAPGIYLYEIQYKEQIEHKRMVVLN